MEAETTPEVGKMTAWSEEEDTELCLWYYIGEGKGSRSRLGPSIDSFRSLGFTPSISVPESCQLPSSFRIRSA